MSRPQSVAIIGAGFTGLAAAYDLSRAGVKVTIFEAESSIGGLASAFDVQGEPLDRFYHHWFTNDRAIMDLVVELGLADRLTLRPTRTGVYYGQRFFRLSTPLDLLRFSPLSVWDRLRLGWLALQARRVRNWRELENKTAETWLRELGGESVFRVMWEPLLKGKFGPYAERVGAVWFWNKLKLRGGSRGRTGGEQLAYLRGGFVHLADMLAAKICAAGGDIRLGSPVRRIEPLAERWRVRTPEGEEHFDQVIATPALPLIAETIESWASTEYLDSLRRIAYLGNVCLVLELDRSLSTTYWLNVNDPSFPFVGVIEHTNFESADQYGGRHIVYLSKYLPHTDALYSYSADAFLDYALPYLQRMFPALRREWILAHHVWRARWSQPVVECGYGDLIPPEQGPLPGFHVCSMAQIYPEDRGTNYAVRNGRAIAQRILRDG
jgi:protoporphyrinogen oxidase